MPNKSDSFYVLGYTSRTHGVNGQVVIKLDVDDPSRYSTLKYIYVSEKDIVKYEIDKAVIQKDTALVFFKGIRNIRDAKKMVGKEVLLPLTDLPQLDESALYLHEAIGMEVVDSSLGGLGPVAKVYDVATQPLAAVIFDKKEVLFPLLKHFIIKVDRENNKLMVNLPDGLLDIYK